MPAKKGNPISNETEYVYQNLDFEAPTKFANELMFAKHSMKENEMKIWLLTMASLAREQEINNDVLYEYNISVLADKLSINKDKGWRGIIREALDHVSDKSLKIVKRYSSEEDKHNWLKIPLYNKKNYYHKLLIFQINEEEYDILLPLFNI